MVISSNQNIPMLDKNTRPVEPAKIPPPHRPMNTWKHMVVYFCIWFLVAVLVMVYFTSTGSPQAGLLEVGVSALIFVTLFHLVMKFFPFVSKISKINFIELATRAMLGEKITAKFQTLDFNYVGVKAPQFSFQRLKGADPILRVEMASTGEVASFGDDVEEAFLKSILAVGFRWPHKNILLSVGGDQNKVRMLESVQELARMKFKLFATEKTSEFLTKNGIVNQPLYKIYERRSPNILEYLQQGKIDLVINISEAYAGNVVDDDYTIRRYAVDYNVPLLTNRQLAKLFIDSMAKKKLSSLRVKEWGEYR